MTPAVGEELPDSQQMDQDKVQAAINSIDPRAKSSPSLYQKVKAILRTSNLASTRSWSDSSLCRKFYRWAEQSETEHKPELDLYLAVKAGRSVLPHRKNDNFCLIVQDRDLEAWVDQQADLMAKGDGTSFKMEEDDHLETFKVKEEEKKGSPEQPTTPASRASDSKPHNSALKPSSFIKQFARPPSPTAQKKPPTTKPPKRVATTKTPTKRVKMTSTGCQATVTYTNKSTQTEMKEPVEATAEPRDLEARIQQYVNTALARRSESVTEVVQTPGASSRMLFRPEDHMPTVVSEMPSAQVVSRRIDQPQALMRNFGGRGMPMASSRSSETRGDVRPSRMIMCDWQYGRPGPGEMYHFGSQWEGPDYGPPADTWTWDRVGYHRGREH